MAHYGDMSYGKKGKMAYKGRKKGKMGKMDYSSDMSGMGGNYGKKAKTYYDSSTGKLNYKKGM